MVGLGRCHRRCVSASLRNVVALGILGAGAGTPVVHASPISSTSAASNSIADPIARRGLLLELAAGFSAMTARWTEYRDPAAEYRASVESAGPALRARAGYGLREGLAAFAEARFDLPTSFLLVTPSLVTGGAGAGLSWFPRKDGVWHIDVAVRRAVGYRLLYWSGVGGGPTNSLDQIWLAECALGRAKRRGQEDAGWSLSVFGGVASPSRGTGFILGTGFIHAWSLF